MSGAGANLPVAVLRGGGDLGTGVALALLRAGWRVVVHDRPRPTALRLQVAFAYAAVVGRWQVAGVTAVRADDLEAVRGALAMGDVAVWVGGLDVLLGGLTPDALVDARMRGLSSRDLDIGAAPLVIALGPGWVAGRDCHAVIETNRGPDLGKVIAAGSAQAHTGVPGELLGRSHERVLRATVAGKLVRALEIGDFVCAGDVVAHVGGEPVIAAIDGMVRGLKLDGCEVGAGHKVGDIDPRRDPGLLAEPTDKALLVGAGVVRALQELPSGARRPRLRLPIVP